MNPLSAPQSLWQGMPRAPLATPAMTGPIPSAELQHLKATRPPAGSAEAAGGAASFSHVLGRMISEVNAKQLEAGQAMTAMQNGQQVSLPQAMIAAEEASVSFQLMVEVRNKLLESYQELMRMQV